MASEHVNWPASKRVIAMETDTCFNRPFIWRVVSFNFYRIAAALMIMCNACGTIPPYAIVITTHHRVNILWSSSTSLFFYCDVMWTPWSAINGWLFIYQLVHELQKITTHRWWPVDSPTEQSSLDMSMRWRHHRGGVTKLPQPPLLSLIFSIFHESYSISHSYLAGVTAPFFGDIRQIECD